MAKGKKTAEVKRKIISLIRNKYPDDAIALFLKHYSESKPAELEFIKNVYVELNRLDFNKAGFDLLAQIGVWYPDSAEFQELFENATQTYAGKLVLQGNNYKYQRKQTLAKFEENIKKADSLTKEKLKEENDKQIESLNNKAIEAFKLAIQFSPDNLTAYNGLIECYQNIDDEETVEQLQNKVKEITTNKQNRFKILEQTITEAAPEDVKPPVDDLAVYQALYDEKKYDDLFALIEKNRNDETFPNESILLKAKALANLKRFAEADAAIAEAEDLYTDYVILNRTKEEISEAKFSLYAKSGSVFLKKAMKLDYPI